MHVFDVSPVKVALKVDAFAAAVNVPYQLGFPKNGERTT